MDQAKVLLPGDEAKVLDLVGDRYRVRVLGAESNGQYFMIEADVPPAAGSPPHIQTREEAFCVLSGESTFYLDDGVKVAPAGSFVHVPRGVKHCFRNDTDAPARLLFWFAPAGIEGMCAELAKSFENFMEVGKAYGVEFLVDEDGKPKEHGHG